MPRNPETHILYRREAFWQITFPLILGIILVVVALAGVILAGRKPVTEGNNLPVVSRWADISLIWLILLGMVISLSALALFGALAYGVTWILRVLPPYAFQAQVIFWRIQATVQKGADLVVEPFLRLRSFWAGLRALRRK